MKKIAFFMLMTVVLGSCRKQPDFDKLSYDPIVVTPHDESVNWSQFKTYYISDTIALASYETTDTIMTGSTAKQLVDRIKSNMDARGFQFKTLAQNPDLVIPTIFIKVNTDVYYGGSYWGYPGYWDPWYYGGGYYYYPYYYSYSYTSGAFVMDICDLKNIGINNDQIFIRWTGFLGGYISDYTSNNVASALEGIDQAFSQSPYIKAGN